MGRITLPQLQQGLNGAADAVRGATNLLRKVALLAEGAAKKRVPVKTGTLRRSITTRVTGKQAFVGSAVVYAPYVEYGTRYTRAQPYLSTGIADALPQIRNLVERYGGQVLENASNGRGGQPNV